MRVRFLHGKRYPMKCSRCDAVRDAVVYRELCDWRARMRCGHHKFLGHTMPLDVLNEMDLVNHTQEKDEQFEEALSDEMLMAKECEEYQRSVNRSSTRNRLYY